MLSKAIRAGIHAKILRNLRLRTHLLPAGSRLFSGVSSEEDMGFTDAESDFDLYK